MCVSSGSHNHKFNVAPRQAQRFVDKRLVGWAMKRMITFSCIYLHREMKWVNQWFRIQNAAILTFFARNAMMQQKQIKHNLLTLFVVYIRNEKDLFFIYILTLVQLHYFA